MTGRENTSVALGGATKIQPIHLQRLAYVYVRQSTTRQVTHNQGSQLYQRRLTQKARALGWPAGRICLIDADLAQSGVGSKHRSGFQELVAEVSLGHVGIIFGYEVSRLARNNSDWYHLLDLAAVFDTLIADADGIYHPQLYNDRLLLGLKGTMSEAELHLLRQRLDAGRMSKVRRGLYHQRLPTGLSRQSDDTVVKSPDDQVRHTIELVFAKFEELGSSYHVFRYLQRENILLPRRQASGPRAGEIVWKVASDSAVYALLTNPAYAGAFVYGRTQTDPTRKKPGKPGTGRVDKPMSEWKHIQQDVYPAYITWEQYLANQEKLRQNGMNYFRGNEQGAQGAAREGPALLQGLATCGYCGHRMSIAYPKTYRYECRGLSRTADVGYCVSLYGPAIDQVVTQAFFDAIRPAQLDALEAILAEQQVEYQRLAHQWQQRLQRAQYEVHLAERQYNAVDPDNRLVAAELERRWELKLRQLQETNEAYDRFRRRPSGDSLSPEQREQFQHISEALPELWSRLGHAQKKALLRSLIKRVILKRVARDQIEVKTVWISGHYSVETAHPPIRRREDLTNYAGMVKRVHELWQSDLTDKEIAARLNEEGFRAAKTIVVKPGTVQKIRTANGWLTPLGRIRGLAQLDGRWTISGLANHLSVERTWVYRRVRNGVIDPKYVTRDGQSKTYLIENDSELLKKLQHLISSNPRS